MLGGGGGGEPPLNNSVVYSGSRDGDKTPDREEEKPLISGRPRPCLASSSAAGDTDTCLGGRRGQLTEGGGLRADGRTVRDAGLYSGGGAKVRDQSHY